MFDTYEDARDAERRAHNRRVTACDEYDVGDIECDCDDPTCGAQHDDCDCQNPCGRCDRRLCVGCLEVSDAGALVAVDGGEWIHPTCAQDLVNKGETFEGFEHVLAARGVTFRAEAAE